MTNIGILGGGQLGMMLIEEGRRAMAEGRLPKDLQFNVMDPSADASCHAIADSFEVGDLQNPEAVLAFGRKNKIVTIEIEKVHADALNQLAVEGTWVCPSGNGVRLIQDKGDQKTYFQERGIASPAFQLADDLSEARHLVNGHAVMLKKRRGGYDGKGVQKLDHRYQSFEGESEFDVPLVVENMVTIRQEIAVIVATSATGEVASFPPVEMVFDPQLNLVKWVQSPANIYGWEANKARKIAEDVASKIKSVGVLAVEMFIDTDGRISVNELAPRPHNSGHLTIEGNATSQFEQHLCAILGLPLGPTDITKPAVMINLIGSGKKAGEPAYTGLYQAQQLDGHIHLYGKTEVRPGRKMGHITVTGESAKDVQAKATEIQEIVGVEAA
jgi:5-(carboxyamino)imidazole ribonucleotide synthase